MAIKRVAINGLGREGRSILRQYSQLAFDDIQIVAANDLMTAENVAYLMKYDSAYGVFQGDVSIAEGVLYLADKSLKLLSEPRPENLPWGDLDIDIVIDCSGQFTTHEAASRHLKAGASRVLIGAPALDADVMLVMGVNELSFIPEQHRVISNASCTTNSLAPVLKLLLDRFGIDYAMVTTIHAYTASQAMVDGGRKKMIQGRAGAVNIIPTSTGADKATIAVLPSLRGRLAALAVRVPVLTGSLTDISVQLSAKTTVDEINNLFSNVSDSPLGKIVGYTNDPLVSSDIVGDPRSGIVHGLSTRMLGETTAKVQVWYDNEYAYARRCLELIELLALK